MKPPEIPGPYVAELAPKPVSPFKVIVIILVTLSVLGVVFIGSVTAIAFGIYRMRAQQQREVAQAEAARQAPTTETMMSLSEVLAPRKLQPGDLLLTATAAGKLREALAMQPGDPHVLVGVDVDPQSCTGLKYRLRVEPSPSSADYCLGKVEGIPIAVERESWALLRGTTLDYLVASESTQGFVFQNPNQTQGTQSTPGDTTMATRSYDSTPKSQPSSIPQNESLTSQMARVRQPIAEVEEAIRLAEVGNTIDYQRVLYGMQQDHYFAGTREQHEQLAAAMEEKLEAAANRDRRSDQKIIRNWRSRASQARLNGGVLPAEEVKEPIRRAPTTDATSRTDRFRERLGLEVDDSFLPPRQTETADYLLRNTRLGMEQDSSPADPLARMRARQKVYEEERKQRQAEHERRLQEILDEQREMVRRATQPPTFP